MCLCCGIICRRRRPPPLRALGLFWYSTSGRQHATADLSSAPPSCQSEEPLPLSVCLPTIQLYTDTHTRSASPSRHTHTHTHTVLSAERVCWYYKTTLVFCVWERSRQKERERESVRPFRVLRVGRPFPFYGTEISNWPVTFALIAISGKQVMHICLKCLLTAFYEARKCNPIMIWLARERERWREGGRELASWEW